MRKPIVRTTAALSVAGLVAVSGAVLTASPAQADIERHGSCSGVPYEFNVDREHHGFEVSLDIDDARPGSRWRVALRHDGRRYHKAVHRADHEGDVEVERFRGNTAGKDVFKVRIKDLATGKVCTARIRTR